MIRLSSIIENFNEKKDGHNEAVRLLFIDFKESRSFG